MRAALAMLLGAALVAAGPPVPEPDAAVAEPARWVEPRGCASGSFRSRAFPVVTEIEEAWQLEFEGIDAPPVHWDGTGYVVAQARGKSYLVAFDLATGKELARSSLRGFLKGSPLLVWDHLVMLQPDEEQITGYRLNGRKLDVTWIFRGRSDARPRFPVVHDNEIYCLLGGELARIRPGSMVASWTVVAPDNPGPPALCGDHVFVASFGAPWEGRAEGATRSEYISDLSLTVHRRSDGGRVAELPICQALYQDKPPALAVTVAGAQVYIGTEWSLLAADGYASHAIVPLSFEGGRVSIRGRVGLWTCKVPPAHHPSAGTLLLSPSREKGAADKLQWYADQDGKIFSVAVESEQPECFRDRVPPTVLGEVVYFGSWAADVETGEILWRLPVTHVTSPAVPADGLVLVVDRGKTLRAFRGRGRK